MVTELCKKAKKFQTDKVQYGYTVVYSDYFEGMRDQKTNIFEIGICKGGSLKMWEDYFSEGAVHAMDFAENGSMRISAGLIDSLNNDRIKTFIGDQNERKDLKSCMDHMNTEYDIIIDDGHHFQSPQQVSWGFLFNKLKSGGIYVIEDICTIWNMKNGSEWGQSDRVNYTDCTTTVLEVFNKTGKIKSPYMTAEEISYLEENIESIDILYPKQQRRGEVLGPITEGSPITGTSTLAMIRKR